jgi:hypothetical protein
MSDQYLEISKHYLALSNLFSDISKMTVSENINLKVIDSLGNNLVPSPKKIKKIFTNIDDLKKDMIEQCALSKRVDGMILASDYSRPWPLKPDNTSYKNFKEIIIECGLFVRKSPKNGPESYISTLPEPVQIIPSDTDSTLEQTLEN